MDTMANISEFLTRDLRVEIILIVYSHSEKIYIFLVEYSSILFDIV